ncbi:hypothetical protein JW906_08955 [bacterium]|nr:hypothetical protein [bacterium]
MFTPTQKSNALPQTFTLKTKKESVQLEAVGPSMWGDVYREKSGNRYFRLLPIDDVPTLAKRKEIDDRRGKPRQEGLAPVVETGQESVGSDIFFFVAYEIRGRNLFELLLNADPQNRLFLMSRVLKALPNWWSNNGDVNFPMPTDIVFYQNWPFLLGLPSLGFWPRFETLIAEPARILFLAPEIVRGNRHLIRDRNIDIYLCAVTALQCLFTVNTGTDTFALLRKAAASTLFEKEHLTSRMPLWMDNVDVFPDILQMIRAALNPDPRIRAGVHLNEMAAKFEALAAYLDPLVVAEDLRSKKKFQKAVDFIEDVCLSESRYDLLMLGARIALEDLKHPLVAVELLERAIPSAPRGNIMAQRLQLAILLKHAMPTSPPLSSKSVQDVGDKLDALTWRDFQALPRGEQDLLYMETAAHFVKRGKFVHAQQILHPHLFYTETDNAGSPLPQAGDAAPSAGPGNFMWWEFQRTLLYAEALIGESWSQPAKSGEARKFLDGIKKALSTVADYPPGDPRRIDAAAVGQYGGRILQLEKMLAAKRK